MHGAELCGLGSLTGPELLWDGDPAVWARQAPHLFPSIGRFPGDAYCHQGQTYAMSPHGFARGLDFDLVRLTREDCTLVLRDTPWTRTIYPFPFELRIRFALVGPSLEVGYLLSNSGGEVLPACLGAHPAFQWPLVSGIPREEHRIRFEKPEPAPIRRQVNGLLAPETCPTPVVDRTLRLEDELFRDDVLILDQVRSRRLRYDTPGGPGLEIRWEGFDRLGIWTKPGAGFVCIEPWAGLPTPEAFSGEILERPGLVLVPPGGRRSFAYSVTLLGD